MQDRSQKYHTFKLHGKEFNFPFSIVPLDQNIGGIRNGRIYAFVFEDPDLLAPITRTIAKGIKPYSVKSWPLISNLFVDYESDPLHTEHMDGLVFWIDCYNGAGFIYYRWNGRIMPLCLEEDADVIIKLSRGTAGITIDICKNKFGNNGVYEIAFNGEAATMPVDQQAHLTEKALAAFNNEPELYTGSSKLVNLQQLAISFHKERLETEVQHDWSNGVCLEDYIELVSQTLNNWESRAGHLSENENPENIS